MYISSVFRVTNKPLKGWVYLLYCNIIECVLNIQCHYNKINQSINQVTPSYRNKADTSKELSPEKHQRRIILECRQAEYNVAAMVHWSFNKHLLLHIYGIGKFTSCRVSVLRHRSESVYWCEAYVKLPADRSFFLVLASTNPCIICHSLPIIT